MEEAYCNTPAIRILRRGRVTLPSLENRMNVQGAATAPLRKTFGPPKADNLFGRSKRRPYDMWN
jgi:hypothetical protein